MAIKIYTYLIYIYIEREIIVKTFAFQPIYKRIKNN
jgi:hypothetical protein